MKNFLLVFLLFSMLSCSKSDLNVTVKSPVFQCCNLWGEISTPYDVFETLPNFLEEKSIEFTDLVLSNNGDHVYCNFCCGCPSGRTVEFKIGQENLEEVLGLGFEEK